MPAKTIAKNDACCKAACRRDGMYRQCQLPILTSSGLGLPFPVSTSDFRLIRKIAHLVLQWCMNSAGSLQP